MKILSLKPSHDGSIAFLSNSSLMFSIEAEKDSFPRHVRITPTSVIKAFSYVNDIPDTICLGGWSRSDFVPEQALEAGYFGVYSKKCKTGKIFWKVRELLFVFPRKITYLLCLRNVTISPR